jgi:hypothetical protein
VNKSSGDSLGRRAPLSRRAAVCLEVVKVCEKVLPASSFVVSGMDVLAEEFGTLTPEQLAAPIPTVEVSAINAESGRDRGRPRKRCQESLGRR